ncbi:MAG TPA: biotin/lipoyl-binding protein [Candidatus Angelobacter sp.]|nr:biotin/lipoyl-binding protein [Candidatus Angelobacter sp.]
MLRTFVSRNVLMALALSALAISHVSCSKTTNAAPANQPLTVQFATVIQQDTPIYSEWIAVLDGCVNAQIQPHVTDYIVKQNYREGPPVRKGDVLFKIDPRPFKAALEQAKAQLSQLEAQARAIAQSQLDTEVQARLGAQAQVMQPRVENMAFLRSAITPKASVSRS